MANKNKQKQTETAQKIKAEDKLPIEEEIKNAETPEDKLELMKKLLSQQKVAEKVKQKEIYTVMKNITVVRNY